MNKNLFFVLLIFFSTTFAFSQSDKELLAVQYFKDGEFEKAVELFKELYQKQPSTYYFSYYFQSLVNTNQLKEAEKLVNRQIKQYPNIQKYKIDLAHLYEMEGSADKAKKQYEKSIRDEGHNSTSIHELAAALLSYQKTDYAIETFLHGRNINKNPTEYTFELATLYAQTGSYEKAITEYLNLLKDNPKEQANIESELTNWLIDDPNNHKQDIIRKNILKYSNKYPDNSSFASLMLWLSLQENNFPAALRQAKAIDKRYKEDGQTVYEIAKIASENLDFKTAIDGYNYLIVEKGEHFPFFNTAQTALLQTKYKQITSIYPVDMALIQDLDKDLELFFSKNTLSSQNAYLYREWINVKSLYLNDLETAQKMLEDALKLNSIGTKEKAILKIDLGDILRMKDDVWEATLLYSQVEKDFPNDTIGHIARYKNAKLSFYLGEFDWAEAQLDVLKAATTKLIANDAMYLSMLIFDHKTDDSLNLPLMYYARADFFFESNRLDEANKMLDSIDKVALYHTLNDDVLYKKAEIAIKQQKYDLADSLLNQLLIDYPSELISDEALFLRATLRETLMNDKYTAMDLYQQLIKDFPNSIYVVDARKRFRALRGDILQNAN